MSVHDFRLLPPPIGGPLFRPQLPDGAVLTAADRLLDRRSLPIAEQPAEAEPSAPDQAKADPEEDYPRETRIQW